MAALDPDGCAGALPVAGAAALVADAGGVAGAGAAGALVAAGAFVPGAIKVGAEITSDPGSAAVGSASGAGCKLSHSSMPTTNIAATIPSAIQPLGMLVRSRLGGLGATGDRSRWSSWSWTASDGRLAGWLARDGPVPGLELRAWEIRWGGNGDAVLRGSIGNGVLPGAAPLRGLGAGTGRPVSCRFRRGFSEAGRGVGGAGSLPETNTVRPGRSGLGATCG